ncbi:hypothetical protein PaeBR_10025 [Paenibacillus sp. BR2-3]|uniref:hypothetical protein n=1 Tax=Paenibacillus sp. BR2-3 TaxID=3048494 RepID=UPI0039775626
MIRHALIFWSAVLLAVIGLVNGVMTSGLRSLTSLIIPLVLGVLLYLLYKYPPRRFAKNGSRSRTKVKPSQKTMAKVAGLRKTHASSGKRKSYPFQVIEGSKGKNDDQLPKYH